MKNVLKIFLTLSGLIFAGSSYSTNPTSVQIFHFNTQTLAWDKQTISNMSMVSEIITAGKYAWAFNRKNATVAFYDGTNWGIATKVSGMYQFGLLRPGFPSTGKQPIAWIEGEDEDGNLVTAYFDGSTWSPAAKVANKDAVGAAFAASSGYVWVGFYDLSEGIFHIKMANSQKPAEWTEVVYPGSPLEGYVMGKSFNDEKPFFYLLFQPANSKYDTHYNLVRIDGSGKGLIIQENIEASGVNVRDNDVLVPIKDIGNESYLYSHDSGNTWKSISVPEGPTPDFSGNYFNGIVCGSASEGHDMKLGCVDSNAVYPTLKEFDLSNYEVDRVGYFNITNSTGLWVGILSSHPYVLHLNVNTGQLTDTNVATVANHTEQLRAIGANELLTLGQNKKHESAAFYYDGSAWTSAVFQPNNKDCDFSSPNDFAATLDKNVWLYCNDEKSRKKTDNYTKFKVKS